MSKTSQAIIPIEELIEETRKHLVTLNYAKDTLRHLDQSWNGLVTFAKSKGIEQFTTELGQQFLKEKYGIELFENLRTSFRRNLRRSVMILSDYQRNGFIHKRQATHLHEWAPGYHNICESFMNHVRQKHLSKGTLRQYRVHLEKLTEYLDMHGAESFSKVTTTHIDGYVATYAGYSKSSISYAFYTIKVFLRYALEQGYISNDISSTIPGVKVNQRANLPSAFTEDEIGRLLAAVDRGNPQGKRDYAILLLAVRYGMRVGEITALKLNDLDFTRKRINYIQSKTGNRMAIDMLESVGWALIDYLKNARPNTNSPNVFVRLVAPYDAFAPNNNLSSIMDKYLSRAGIRRLDERHYGMHTIRHSLASHLLEQGNPLHIVSGTLGHLELNSTMIYTKIDLKTLAFCALEVPNETERV